MYSALTVYFVYQYLIPALLNDNVNRHFMGEINKGTYLCNAMRSWH
jgi:hypothetical protein